MEHRTLTLEDAAIMYDALSAMAKMKITPETNKAELLAMCLGIAEVEMGRMRRPDKEVVTK